MSCNKDEELCFDNIIGTYKEFFCSICWKYNCSLHGINKKVSYDNPEAYDMKAYINSFTNLCNDIIKFNKENEVTNEIILDNNQDILQEVYNRKTEMEILKNKLIKNNNNNFSDKNERENECENQCFLALVKSRKLDEGLTEKKELSSLMKIFFDKVLNL